MLIPGGVPGDRPDIARYEEVCSEVISNFVYVGGVRIAQDLNAIVSRGITHVINCAADTILNFHIENGIQYATLPLKDDGLVYG